MDEYTVGTKAYYDSLSGLIPVTITAVWFAQDGNLAGVPYSVVATVDEDGRGFTKGREIISMASKVPPRDRIRVDNNGKYKINVDYRYVPLARNESENHNDSE